MTAPATTLFVPAHTRSSRPVIKGEVVDPTAMTEVCRADFAQDLYEAHSRIFAGVSKACFVKYVVEPEALRTRIEVFRHEGRIVGYSAVHFFERIIEGRRVVVMRGECGMERRFRGGASAGNLLSRETAVWLMRHPFGELWWLGSLIHPSSYRSLSRHMPEFYPQPASPTPEPVQHHIRSMAASFGLHPISSDEPDVVEVGWQTRDSAQDQLYWQSRRDPATRFFIERNPGFSRGHGLLTAAPLSLTTIAAASARMLWRRARRRLFGSLCP